MLTKTCFLFHKPPVDSLLVPALNFELRIFLPCRKKKGRSVNRLVLHRHIITTLGNPVDSGYCFLLVITCFIDSFILCRTLFHHIDAVFAIRTLQRNPRRCM